MKIPKSEITRQTIQYSGIFGLDFKYSDIGWYDFRIYIEKMDGHAEQVENFDCLNIDNEPYEAVVAFVNEKITEINKYYGTDFKPINTNENVVIKE